MTNHSLINKFKSTWDQYKIKTQMEDPISEDEILAITYMEIDRSTRGININKWATAALYLLLLFTLVGD